MTLALALAITLFGLSWIYFDFKNQEKIKNFSLTKMIMYQLVPLLTYICSSTLVKYEKNTYTIIISSIIIIMSIILVTSMIFKTYYHIKENKVMFSKLTRIIDYLFYFWFAIILIKPLFGILF